MLMDRKQSALLIVDVQERLLPHMHDWQRLLDNVIWLVKLAQRTEVPIAASEQYTKGLGRSHPALRALLPDEAVAEKLHFSCVAGRCLDSLPGSGRAQAVVAGIESHVCVLQTALDLAGAGKQVFVVADAVASRDPANRELALARMRDQGVQIVSREMVAFEWLHQAGSDLFREVNKAFLR